MTTAHHSFAILDCATEDAYLAALQRLLSDPAEPAALPVLGEPDHIGPAISEVHNRLPPESWSGDVIVVGTGPHAAVGQVLARLTGRAVHTAGDPVEALALASSVDPTTIVADWRAVTTAFLSLLSDKPKAVGLFVARDLVALSALLVRTLTARPIRDLAVLEVAPSALSEATDAYVTGEDARTSVVRPRLRTPLDLLVLNGHGRECAFHLLDGVICGRGRPPAAEVPSIRSGWTSCLHGEGCYRRGWVGERILPIREAASQVVFVDSCMAFKVADSQFRAETMLGLTALEGGALAFIGSPWLRSGASDDGQRLQHALRTGLTLGAAVRSLNDRVRRDDSVMGELCLLGDAGLRLGAPAAGCQHPHTEVAVGVRRRVRRAAAEPADRDPLRRALARLRDLDVFELDEFAPLVRRAAEAEDAAETLADCHQAIAEKLVRHTGDHLNHFMDTYVDKLSIEGWTRAACASCGNAAARRYRLVHRLRSALRRDMVVCPLCGEVDETPAEAELDVTVEGRTQGSRGGSLAQYLTVHNRTPHRITGSVGFTVLFERLYGTTSAAVRPFEVGPGATTRLEFTVAFGDRTTADVQRLRFFVVAAGAVWVASRNVWVAPQ